MKRSLFAVLLFTVAAPLAAQTQIQTSINANQALQVARIAIPRPDTTLPLETFNAPFFAPLTRDLAYSGVFAIAPIPPNIAPGADLAKAANAQFVLSLHIEQHEPAAGSTEPEYWIDARMLDAGGTLVPGSGKRYRATAPALSRAAHMLASDLVRLVNGRPGIFMSDVAFASNRTGNFEIWLMDWDGANQRQITRHNALSILPSFSADGERLAYTSFFRGTSDMYVINRRGGGRVRVPTGLNLNTSAAFSPTSNDVAFVGSVNGNPDIYVIKDDGTNLRRLTHDTSIESTPEWSPNGRQISFTSGRSGSPQIYTMDAEGSNVQRISFDGDWNDDATWSPDGSQLAYTSRVAGRFQIRIFDIPSGKSRIVAGEGSNEQPAWSPDGQWIVFQSNRTGKWQIYRMRADGTDLLQLTFTGENKDPDWSKKPE